MTQITHHGVDASSIQPHRAPTTSYRIGAQFTRFPGTETTPLRQGIATALEQGYTSITLNNFALESRDTDVVELRGAARDIASSGSELLLGLGSAGPVQEARTARAELAATLAAGLDLGCTEYFLHTRTERTTVRHGERTLDHPAQLSQILHTLGSLHPVAAAAGARLNLKTHEDLSSAEVKQVIDRLDPEVFGIGLDVANLVVRGEDPVKVTRALAPQVRSTHLEDLVLFPIDTGYRRRLCPIGQGVLPWDEILGSLWAQGVRTFTIEQHRGRFDTPVHNRAWFENEPHLHPDDLGQLARMARATTALVEGGQIPELERWNDDPSATERAEQFAASAAYLRRALQNLSSTTVDDSTQSGR
ncbi:sugar phosphate isomerase/epimerase family protein [Paeniglutamicibacter kerguelensis]|uniref:Sugar phosphate isomerase/epimerase n=1 Tax=Paeniglutamicibacter kerguelensis TaxID=254788 RepID=A0ABS4XA05_9MICC|nr:TIM barrel protein [Paeniglutamicibacter kerguelensis]MBP2385201.1 sugar phosphate isomerase/epimerase [Paeniglutamicibacter kerguelensis]